MAIDYRQEARRAAVRHGLDPSIFERQIGVESIGYSPDVISGRTASPKGAQGIAQFMPATAHGMGVNPLHPIEALDAAARLMHSYVKKYGNYADALTAYNAGPGRVGHPLYAETRNYISKILGGHNVKSTGTAALGERMAQSAVTTTTIPDPVTKRTFRQGAYDQATKESLLAQFLSRQPGAKDNTLLTSGLLSLTPPNPANYYKTSTTYPEIQTSTVVTGAGPRVGAAGHSGVMLAPHGGWNGTEGPLNSLFHHFGKPLGLTIASTKRNNTNPYSGSRSDHDFGNKSAYAIDASNGSAPTPQMDDYAYKVMHALGFKSYRRGQSINTSQGVKVVDGLQYQVIYRGSGRAYGGNHLNHVHVGVHRVR